MADSIQGYTREGLLGIINAMPVAVMVVDQHLFAVLTNTAALKFTEKNSGQIIGKKSGLALGCINALGQECGFGLSCTTCTLRGTLQETFKKRIPLHTVETNMDFDQKGERILRFSTLPLALDQDLSVLLTIEDLTEARVYEQEQLEKEKLTAVLETTGGVCHELSQPLQVIMGYCEVLAEYQDIKTETARAVTAIAIEIKKIARLVHDLNHITRYETKPYLKSKIIDIQKSSSRPEGPSPKNKKSP